jgi:hypothetical protein
MAAPLFSRDASAERMTTMSDNRPTPADIATVIADVKAEKIFDPSEHPDFWNCDLYVGDHRVGEGQGATAAQAMSYAWVHAHSVDGLSEPSDLVKVPPECDGDQWHFAVTSPDDLHRDDHDDGVSQFAVISAADNCIYGPFHTYASADHFAEEADGSIFKLVRVGEGER